jgi:hypothetical protein
MTWEKFLDLVLLIGTFYTLFQLWAKYGRASGATA